jgi:hypothetical protein
VEAANWLANLERGSAKAVDDAALKLAQYPRRDLPRLNRNSRYFLAERLRMVAVVIEAISTTQEQATKPVFLFQVQRYDGLEEQQIAWALVTYWSEFGRTRWYLEQLHFLAFAAQSHGWTPEEPV